MPESQIKLEESEKKLDKPNKKVRSFQNKVVIRKLPPNLNEEAFIEIISPLPDYNELYFCSADWTLGAEATSRAYIEFKNEEDIFIFKDKFDGYVFVDAVRGSEYPAIVEYAAFQGIPKSRARKKDKNVGTIESEQHFISFLENLKAAEEAENNKSEQITRIEYSYQIKDDKKITSTPLIEFLSAKNQEKRDAKRKKVEEKRKKSDEDKQRKKIQIAKNVPQSIKEEESNEDGIMVRTVPSRLARNDRKKDKPDKGNSEKSTDAEHERLEKRDRIRAEKDAERQARRKMQREENRQAKRDQKGQDKDEKSDFKKSVESEKPLGDIEQPTDTPEKSESSQLKESKRESSGKPETKRYSALRKARQEKPDDSKNVSDSQKHEESSLSLKDEASSDNPRKPKKPKIPKDQLTDQDRLELKEARMKKARENKIRERRAREADERAQRQIKNKDRPTLQIYQPKRRQDTDTKPDNSKSSDDSEKSRKKSDSDRKNERRDQRPDKKSSRKNSSDETTRKKRASREEVIVADESKAESNVGDKESVVVAEKLEKLSIEPTTSGEAKADVQD